MKRSISILCVLMLLVLATAILTTGYVVGASAQDNNESGSSSVEDQATPPLGEPAGPSEPAAPDAVISWRVTGSALRPRENDVNYLTNATGGCVYATAGDTLTVWNIPVQLPQGALVDSLRMYFFDASPSDFSGWFTVYDLYGNIVQEWSVTSTGSAGNGFNDTGMINQPIDYSIYSYVLNWRPGSAGSSLQLCGFRIFYTAPMFGAGFVPVIRNDNP